MMTWNEFRSLHKGKGHSMSQLAMMYRERTTQSKPKDPPRCTEGICYINKEKKSKQDQEKAEIAQQKVKYQLAKRAPEGTSLDNSVGFLLTQFKGKQRPHFPDMKYIGDDKSRAYYIDLIGVRNRQRSTNTGHVLGRKN